MSRFNEFVLNKHIPTPSQSHRLMECVCFSSIGGSWLSPDMTSSIFQVERKKATFTVPINFPPGCNVAYLTPLLTILLYVLVSEGDV